MCGEWIHACGHCPPGFTQDAETTINSLRTVRAISTLTRARKTLTVLRRRRVFFDFFRFDFNFIIVIIINFSSPSPLLRTLETSTSYNYTPALVRVIPCCPEHKRGAAGCVQTLATIAVTFRTTGSFHGTLQITPDVPPVYSGRQSARQYGSGGGKKIK